MAKDQTVAPVIIKRKKIIAADGHHGGAWKVAYADFETFLKILTAQIQNQDPIKLEFELPFDAKRGDWLFKHKLEMKFSTPLSTQKITHCIGRGRNRTARM